MWVDNFGVNLLELPIAGEGELELVPPPKEMPKVVTPPEEHAYISVSVLQRIDKVGLDDATVTALPVTSNKGNFHSALTLKLAHTRS